MSSSYTEKFNVLEVFEQNPYQKIMMGAYVDNPDNVVVINVFKKGVYLSQEFLDTAKEALSNLIHSEENENEVVLVTDYQEGMSLVNYLESFTGDMSARTALADTYMQNILKYAKFNSYFKTIFLDDNQIIVQEEKLLMNELIIVDEQIEQSIQFDSVVSKVAATLSTIFNSGKQVDGSDEIKERVGAFLSSLSVNASLYKTLDELYDAYKKTFIFDATLEQDKAAPIPVPVDLPDSKTDPETRTDASEGSNEAAHQKEIELDGLEVVEDIFEDDDTEEGKKNGGPIALILIAIALLAAFFAFANPFSKEEVKLPEASFVRQEIDGKLHFENTSTAYGKDNSIVLSEWNVYSVSGGEEKKLKTADDHHLDLIIKNSGTYKVELKVQDQNKQWSASTSEEFNYAANDMDNLDENSDTASPQEKLEKFLIEYDSANISRDTEIFRSGTESLKMDLAAGDAEITLKDLGIENNSIISLWLLSDDTAPVDITFKGYKNGQLVFTKDMTHVPRAANIWEMVEAKVNGENADSLKINFSGSSTIWVDDIDISSFK